MHQATKLRPLFHPGRLLVTPAALTTLRSNSIPVISVMLRHIAGDWGIVSNEDRAQNDLSIEAGLRLLSIYRLPDGAKVWVVTEWDRSHTTIRLAGDTSVRTSGAGRVIRNRNSIWPTFWYTGRAAA
jgi:hypothetical protein